MLDACTCIYNITLLLLSFMYCVNKAVFSRQSREENDLEDRRLLNTGQFSVKLSSWNHKILTFKWRWLFNRGAYLNQAWVYVQNSEKLQN